MTTRIAAGLAAATTITLALLGAAAGARAQFDPSSLPPNWHVHDCGLPESVYACGGQHKGAGFFPRILGVSGADYVADPAECPNATDKAFLPGAGSSDSDLVRAGVCMTSTTVIHLRTVPAGTVGPDGWSSFAGPETGDVTYFLLTAR